MGVRTTEEAAAELLTEGQIIDPEVHPPRDEAVQIMNRFQLYNTGMIPVLHLYDSHPQVRLFKYPETVLLLTETAQVILQL